MSTASNRHQIHPFPSSFPEEIILNIARILARDGQTRTLANLASTTSYFYETFTPMMYDTIHLTETSSIFFVQLARSSVDPASMNMTDLDNFKPPSKELLELDSDQADRIRKRSKYVKRIFVLSSSISAINDIPTYSEQRRYGPLRRPNDLTSLFPNLEEISFDSELVKQLVERIHIPDDESSIVHDPIPEDVKWCETFNGVCRCLWAFTDPSPDVSFHFPDTKIYPLSPSLDLEIRHSEAAQLLTEEFVSIIPGRSFTFYNYPFASIPISRPISRIYLQIEPNTFVEGAIVKVLKYPIGVRAADTEIMEIHNIPPFKILSSEPLHRELTEVDLDVDDPPGLPNTFVKSLWKIMRETAESHGLRGYPDPYPSPTHHGQIIEVETVTWSRIYHILTKQVVFVPSEEV